jgi:hypothetical protein
MEAFEVGDIVYLDYHEGVRVRLIDKVVDDENAFQWEYVDRPNATSEVNWDYTSSFIFIERPNKKHKHYDLIMKWASNPDGHVVIVDGVIPLTAMVWNPDVEYEVLTKEEFVIRCERKNLGYRAFDNFVQFGKEFSKTFGVL